MQARRMKGPGTVPISTHTDEELLCLIGKGDREAFRLLFLRFFPRVKSYLKRLGASNSAADDLAQDAMVSLWRRASLYDTEKARASTWIFVIARNAWIDKLRREKVDLAYKAVLSRSQDAVTEHSHEELVASRRASNLLDVLKTLPEDQQQVVRLSFFEERPHSEIAERLDLPLGTVKSRLRLALNKLRAQWERLQ
jgi:RNA polymerase sigma-70 factor (ECF subfamily)